MGHHFFHTQSPLLPEATSTSLTHFLLVSCHCVTEHEGKRGRINTRHCSKLEFVGCECVVLCGTECMVYIVFLVCAMSTVCYMYGVSCIAVRGLVYCVYSVI